MVTPLDSEGRSCDLKPPRAFRFETFRMKSGLVFVLIISTALPALAHWPRHKLDAKTTKAAEEGRSSAAPNTANESNARAVSEPSYLIGLGDVLHISVWREPEFTSSVVVRSDGKISLPLLADINAVGTSPMQLAEFITERLTKYVDDPRVTVIVSQSKPLTIYMVGEVGHHGPMALTPNMTVLQAIVTAGLTQFANEKKIYVLRFEKGVQHKFLVNYKRLVKGSGAGQNIELKPGDMVVVP